MLPLRKLSVSMTLAGGGWPIQAAFWLEWGRFAAHTCDQQVVGRIYWGGQQIAFRSWSSPTYFEHQDWEGTERARTDPWGNLQAGYASLAFGDGSTQTVGGTMVGQDNNSFAGLELDPETETYHAQFRQYGLAQGSWMSPDPYSGSYDMNNPQSLNRYSYVLNNPLAFTDRLGLDSGFDCGDNCVGVTGTPDPDPCGEDPSFCSPSGPGSPTGNALPLPPIPPPANRPPNYVTPWYQNSYITNALLKGAATAGLDAIGTLPEGGVISAAFSGFHGAAGVSNGINIWGRVAFGAALISTVSGAHDASGGGPTGAAASFQAGIGAVGIAKSLGAAIPVAGQVIAGIAVIGDFVGTGIEVANCH